MKRTVFSLAILTIGVMLLLRVLDIEPFDWFFVQEWRKFVTPIILICFGLWLLLNRSHYRYTNGECDCTRECYKEADVSEVMDENAFLDASTCFANNSYDLEGERFTGANACVCMGNMKVDLRKAIIDGDCKLSLKAYAGALYLFVPQNVNITMHVKIVSGDVDNRTVKCTSPSAPKLNLDICSVMGKVVVKN